MGLNCGIVGLPNVGKSTIFNALTSAPAEAANYPFCTIDPNVGIVNVRDRRLDELSKLVSPERVVPAIVEFVDIAGLVRGASNNEGMGNEFLGHIRQVQAIMHVVRCFDDEDIIHVEGRVDPIEDIETINLELCLADLDTVKKRLDKNIKFIKSQDKLISTKAKIAQPILEKLEKSLSEGISAISLGLDKEEKDAISDLHLLTLKDILYVCNIDESAIHEDNEYVKLVRDYASKHDQKVIKICGKLESEISSLDTDAEKDEFRETAGLTESGLDQLIEVTYQILGLRTYFTVGKKEVRAWTFHKGAKAPEAAAVIHTDFERGFIKAEVFHYNDFIEAKSEAKVKENGKLRVEGKEYVVQDGDIMHFRFNV